MINNKNLIGQIYSLLFLLILLIAKNASADTVANNQNLPLQPGDYMTATFIEALKKTRSPFYAMEHSKFYPNMNVRVSDDGSRYSFTPNNFHSSGGEFEMDASLKSVVSNPPKNNTFKEKIVRGTDADFTFASNWESILKRTSSKKLSSADKFETVKYVYVGKYKNYINRNTVAGKYKDNEGRLYIMTEEGEAIFPENNFPYEVELDFFSQDFDLIRTGVRKADKTRGKYAFKVDNASLQLFNVVNGDGGEFIDKP